MKQLINNLSKFKDSVQDHFRSQKKPLTAIIVLRADEDVITLELDGRAIQISPDKGFLKAVLKRKAFDEHINELMYFIAEGLNKVTDKENFNQLKKEKQTNDQEEN